MPEQQNKEKPNNPGGLAAVADFARANKVQTAALIGSLTIGADSLMGTSALTPYIANPWVAAAALGTSIGLLMENGKTAVQSTIALGSKWGLSAMTLGLIVGSLNTIPETAVSVSSALQGALELGTGNVVGSNIAHVLVVLGIPAALMGIEKSKDLSWKFNTYVMAGTAALFGAQLVAGSFSPFIGAGMLGLGGYYLWKRFKTGAEANHDHDHDHEHDHDHDEEEESSCAFHDHGDDHEIKAAKKRPVWLNTALTATGMAGLVAASHLIVGSGVQLADKFNFSALGLNIGMGQAAIGAILVALGTAAPEIAISIEAIRKKHSDLAVGNVLGCSIINTLVAGGILSMSGLIHNFNFKAIPVPDAFTLNTSMGMLNTGLFLGTAALMTATLLKTKGAVSRWMGGAALALYGAYIAGSLALGDGKLPHLHDHGTVQPQKIEIVQKLLPPPPTIKL